MGRHSSLSQPHGYREAGVLDGARILVARAPDRAGELVTALRDAGAEPILLPLIDFEVASDQHSFDVAFDALGAGAYAWLVISSVTAVQALEAKAAERGATLETWLPGSLQVATIGPATRRALQLRGIGVDLAPSAEQSGAGLAGVWPEGRTRVFLPQADIADPALRRGLEAKGASVQAVTAYRTVDYPADPARSLATLAVATGDRSAAPPAAAPPAAAPPAAVLTAAEAKAEVKAGRLHAVVAASPSAARRIHAELAPLGGCRFVAIGRSTAGQAEALGLTVASTAEQPTASGLLAAVIRSLATTSAPAPPTPAAEHPAKDKP